MIIRRRPIARRSKRGKKTSKRRCGGEGACQVSAKGLVALIAAMLSLGCASKVKPPSNEREACARMPGCMMGPDLPPNCIDGQLHLDDSGTWYGCTDGAWKILPEFRPPAAVLGSGKPKLMYAWTLPGSTVVRTCQLGEQFVDKHGQLYVCGQWPPYEVK